MRLFGTFGYRGLDRFPIWKGVKGVILIIIVISSGMRRERLGEIQAEQTNAQAKHILEPFLIGTRRA